MKEQLGFPMEEPGIRHKLKAVPGEMVITGNGVPVLPY